MYSTSMPVYRRLYYNIYIYTPSCKHCHRCGKPTIKVFIIFRMGFPYHGFSTSMGHPMCELVKLPWGFSMGFSMGLISGLMVESRFFMACV